MTSSNDPSGPAPGQCRLPPGRADASVESVLPSLLHDLRSRVTALSSFAELLRQHVEDSTDQRARGLVDAVQANQELIVQALEGVALLRGGSFQQAQIATLLREQGTKLQKVLSRSRIALNLRGETPDRDVESRSFAAAVGHVLTASSRVLGRLSGSTMEVSVSTDTTRASVSFAVSWPEPREGVAAELAASLAPEPGSFAAAVLARALAQLDGDLAVRPDGHGALVTLGVACRERSS